MTPFPEFLFAESSHRQALLPAGAPDLKRFQELKRVTVDEEFIGWRKTQAANFGAGGVLDPLHGANKAPPTTPYIIRWIAWAQLAMGLLLLWSALGDAPIPAVLTLP